MLLILLRALNYNLIAVDVIESPVFSVKLEFSIKENAVKYTNFTITKVDFVLNVILNFRTAQHALSINA